MRQLFFRIYSKSRNEMYLSPKKNKDLDTWFRAHYNECWGGDENDTVIMQYTELIDSKGNYIFEGDIVRIEPKKNFICEEKNSCIAIVYFQTAGFCLNCIKCNGCINSIRLFDSRKNHNILTVIGNIYQNPELAKSSDN